MQAGEQREGSVRREASVNCPTNFPEGASTSSQRVRPCSASGTSFRGYGALREIPGEAASLGDRAPLRHPSRRKTRFIGLGANQIAAYVLASAYNLLRIAKLAAAT